MTITMEEGLIAELKAAPAGSGIICVMNHTGDKRSMWDPRNKEEVAVAEAEFNAARAQKMLIYSVDPEDGKKKEVIQGPWTKKIAKLGKVIMAVPQPVGG